MDNLAHGLFGAALGEAGLKKKTGLGLATLIIAANIPDIDALGLLFGENLAWRRGWTHGPLAWLVLPFLLTGLIILFDRWQARRGTRPKDRLPVKPRWVLALSVVGVLSHPLLDFLNTYGIRCLMPFSERWFYGDTLFIIDLWVWFGLGLGVWMSRRRARRGQAHVTQPARWAILGVASYTLAMGSLGIVAAQLAAKDVVAEGYPVPQSVIASPVPVDPFRRNIVVQGDDAYLFGVVRFGLRNPAGYFVHETDWVPTNMDDPRVAAAADGNKILQDFLYWARVPFATFTETDEGLKVTVQDARYARGRGGSSFKIETVIDREAGRTE